MFSNGGYLLKLAFVAKMLNRGGKTNVMSVTVLPPTRDNMAPKLGMLSAMKSNKMSVDVLNTHRFHVNSKIISSYV